MRKAMKKKLRSCPTCKPNKTGGGLRWKTKEFSALRLAEGEIRDAYRSGE